MPDTLSKNKRQYAKSSSFLMALLFTVLCGAAALSFGYFIHYFAKGHFVQNTQAVLDSEIKYITALGTLPAPSEYPERIYIPLSNDGKLPEGFHAPSNRLAEGLLVFDNPNTSQRFAARIQTLPDEKKILIGTDITEVSHDFRFMQWIGIASISFVMIVVFISYLISVFVVRGTNKIAETAHEIIKTGDLSRRVEMTSHWDDLSNMASALNMLLSRIEELMLGVRQVSDNIAHDLRTPLTRMRSHIETLQKEAKNPQPYDDLLKETDQILATFNALLRIARIETERQRSQFETLDLHNLLNDVIEFYQPLAEDKGITISAELQTAQYRGDRNLLFQAFANLIDNAVKFTPEGGLVNIDLKHNQGHLAVVIQDNGPGVPEDQKAKIFERFYRTEKCRSVPGVGLGLSLVSAVISLHGGSISIENAQPGLRTITIL